MSTWSDVAPSRNQEPTDGYRKPGSGEPSWSDVAPERNSKDIGDYDRGDVKRSIWDSDVQDELSADEQDRLRREQEARESWLGDNADYDEDYELELQRKGPEGMRKSARNPRRPAAFDKDQRQVDYLNGHINGVRARRNAKRVRHPVLQAKKSIKRKAKKKAKKSKLGQLFKDGIF